MFSDTLYRSGTKLNEDTKQAIKLHIKEKYKIELENLINFKGVDFTPLKKNEKKTIYITEAGLYSLVMKSKKQEAESFQDYVMDEILENKGTW